MKVVVHVEAGRCEEEQQPLVVLCDRITQEERGIAFRVEATEGPHVTTPPVAFVKWSEFRWYTIADAEVRIVFDGPPGPEGARFIEVENEKGEGLKIGEWRELDDGRWALVLTRTVDE